MDTPEHTVYLWTFQHSSTHVVNTSVVWNMCAGEVRVCSAEPLHNAQLSHGHTHVAHRDCSSDSGFSITC